MSNDKKQIREAFRTAVLERDGHKCRIPGCILATMPMLHVTLDAHHITDRHEMPNGGYVPENGITLCPPHHGDAELWHRSGHVHFIPGMHPDDLYRIIGSSHALAVLASEDLQP